jgi:hypothetical protein
VELFKAKVNFKDYEGPEEKDRNNLLFLSAASSPDVGKELDA